MSVKNLPQLASHHPGKNKIPAEKFPLILREKLPPPAPERKSSNTHPVRYPKRSQNPSRIRYRRLLPENLFLLTPYKFLRAATMRYRMTDKARFRPFPQIFQPNGFPALPQVPQLPTRQYHPRIRANPRRLFAFARKRPFGNGSYGIIRFWFNESE